MTGESVAEAFYHPVWYFSKGVFEMKKYERPLAAINEMASEGVFAASGVAGTNCYLVTWNIFQTPQNGRGEYRLQINAHHDADHHSTEQILVITFTLPVVYESSNGTLESGSGTNTLRIKFNYHNNNNDNIGMGDLIVTADAGLAVSEAYMECNMKCDQHS